MLTTRVLRAATPWLACLALVPAAIAQPARVDTLIRDATAPRYPGGGTLVQELQFGTVDGPEESSFANIASILQARDGRIWVLDFTAMTSASLKLFDAAGKFVRTVGGPGGGPGEYRGPTGLAQLPDGRVLLRDIAGNRINVYRPDGAYDTTWTFRTAHSWSVRGRDPIRVDVNGVVWLPFRDASAVGGSFPMLRMRANGTILDTVAAPVMPDVSQQTVTITTTAANGNTSRATTGPEYQPGVLSFWTSGGYLAVARSDRYELNLLFPDRVVRVRRNVAPVPVSEAERRDRDALLEWMVNQR